jgi:hypothetical protein
VSAASFVRRLTLAAAILVLAFASSASAGLGLSGPRRIVQGGEATITAAVRSGTRCTLLLKYRSGTQRASTTSSGGKAVFRFEVPRRAATGQARATVSCAGAGRASMTVMVIGSVIPAKINVVKQGFTYRIHRSGHATVSWGVIVSNLSPEQDALKVTVLANFVMPDNRLIASSTKQIELIPAGGTYVGGGDVNFVGAPPIARLEIVAQIGDRGPPKRLRPAIAEARPVPAPYDEGYVGSVEGEIQNDNATKTLQRATISTVVLDAEGNVLGGGSGYASASLPPGARQFFKISSGFRAIPFARVASTIISISPTYR